MLDALGLGAGTGTDLLVNILTLAAMVGGVWVCQKLPRRPWVIWSFWVGAVASVALGVGAGSLPTWSILVLFLVFIVVTNAASNLEFVYPPELFPTEVRSSGQGITVATARIGSVLSTWVLPSLLLTVGISWTMIILGGVSAVGAIASHLWAPETQGLSLLEASGAKETSGSSSRLGSSEVLQGAGVVSRD